MTLSRAPSSPDQVHLSAGELTGYGYIVASRLKKLPTDLTEKILDPPGYIEVSSPDGNLEEGFRYQVFPYEKRGKAGKNPVTLSERLIVTSSSRRAPKEASDRERLIAKAHQFLENPSTVSASFPR
ncbi:MAG: hypothetical protein WCP87_01895, partial [Atribacterota bacterium]